MIALFAVLIAIAYYVPIISLFATFLAPLPLAWYSASYDRKSSIFVAIIGCIITLFFGGLLILPFSLIFASIGVVMGDALRLKKSKVFLFMSSSINVLITFALQYVLLVNLLNINVKQIMRETYTKSIELPQSLTGQTPDVATMNSMFDMMESTLPATITIGVFALTFIIMSINLPLLKRFGINVPKFRSIKNIRLPRPILWYYLIVLAINLFISPETGTPLYVIILNFSLILWLLLTIQGVSFLHFVLDAFGSPKFLKVLAIIMAIPLYSFYVLIGILDLGFDIRSFVKGKIQK